MTHAVCHAVAELYAWFVGSALTCGISSDWAQNHEQMHDISVLNHRSAAGTKEGLGFRFTPQGRSISHLTQLLCRVAAGSLRSVLGFHWRTIMILMDEYLFVCIHVSCSFYFVVKFDFPNTVWTQQLLYEPVAFKIIKVLILYNSSRGWRCLHPNCQVAFLTELFPHWAEKELTVSMSRCPFCDRKTFAAYWYATITLQQTSTTKKTQINRRRPDEGAKIKKKMI